MKGKGRKEREREEEMKSEKNRKAGNLAEGTGRKWKEMQEFFCEFIFLIFLRYALRAVYYECFPKEWLPCLSPAPCQNRDAPNSRICPEISRFIQVGISAAFFFFSFLLIALFPGHSVQFSYSKKKKKKQMEHFSIVFFLSCFWCLENRFQANWFFICLCQFLRPLLLDVCIFCQFDQKLIVFLRIKIRIVRACRYWTWIPKKSSSSKHPKIRNQNSNPILARIRFSWCLAASGLPDFLFGFA